MYNYVSLVGVIKEFNKEERFAQIEVRRYERFLDESDQSTTFKVYIPESIANSDLDITGKVVGIKGHLVLDSTVAGAVNVICERIIGFDRVVKKGE